MEQIQIIGHIGQDAVIKDFDGKQYGSFSVGVSSGYKNAEGARVESTNWYNVLTLETSRVQWLKSGAKVFVQGRSKTSIYRSREGEARISRDISAAYIDILVFAKDETATDPGTPPASSPPGRSGCAGKRR